MIHTLKFLNVLGRSQPRERCLDLLKRDYGIKVSNNPEHPDLYCLNYDQINSPKLHNITRECRSFVIEAVEDKGNNIVSFRSISRSFDRFYNLTEDPDQEVDLKDLILHEKLDGSLVSVFYYKGKWIYRTKSMIMPNEDMKVNGSDLSWKELIESTCSRLWCELDLFTHLTFIFEVVSPENRIVTKYIGRKAYLIAIRSNSSGDYIVQSPADLFDWEQELSCLDIKLPKTYSFSSLEDCQEAVKNLPNLEEGYVAYNSLGVPVVKIKSPAYLAAHRLRGELVLSGKRIMDMLFIGEEDEYLAIFPEDAEKFRPYEEAYGLAVATCWSVWADIFLIQDQKEYALKVKDLPLASLLFTKKRNRDFTFQECFDKLRAGAKYKVLEAYLC